MDITYIPMARGFVYLAVVLDWASRRVLAWRLSITMELTPSARYCLDDMSPLTWRAIFVFCAFQRSPDYMPDWLRSLSPDCSA